MIPRSLLALNFACCPCSLNLSESSTITPKSFSTCVSISGAALSCDAISYVKSMCSQPIRITAFIGVELHLPLLGPRMQVVQITLELSTVFCSCDRPVYLGIIGKKYYITFVTSSGRSLIYTTNSTGPNTLPCGIPLITSVQDDFCPLMTTHWRRLFMKDSIHARSSPSMPYPRNLQRSL